jgi:prephenate dehydratase
VAVVTDVGGGSERWTYLGPQGTFTEQAARMLADRLGGADSDIAGGDIELEPVAGVSTALNAVRRGTAHAACVALESSVEGAVPLTQDELTHGDPLMITAEAYVPITFDLLVRPGTELTSISTVGAHPHGHAQIREWLAMNLPHAEAVMSSSNAAAAPVAGPRYGLVSLAADIGEIRDAVTRFVLLRRPGPPPPPTGNDRTSLVLSVGNHPGSLLAVLGEFASRGINLTRLESRPARSKLGVYVFLVDADGHLAEPAMAEVLSTLVRRSALLRLLGSYPRIEGTNVPLPDFASAAAYHQASDQVARWTAGEWS